MIPVVTIDGPSGSGKGTAGKLLAESLGWHYLDSGALYRLVALQALEKNVASDDVESLCVLAKELPVEFQTHEGEANILLEGRDVSLVIRGEEVGGFASQISVIPELRQALLQRQRDFQREPGLVTDGRDMGTVVFPEALMKFFLVASPQKRALRRQRQLREQGIDAKLDELIQGLAERDQRDRERAVAPSKPAADARVIDSTDLSIDKVFEQILQGVQQARNRGSN